MKPDTYMHQRNLRQKPLRNDRISLYLIIIHHPQSRHDEDESPEFSASTFMPSPRTRQRMFNQGHAEQGRGNLLHLCPVAYQ